MKIEYDKIFYSKIDSQNVFNYVKFLISYPKSILSQNEYDFDKKFEMLLKCAKASSPLTMTTKNAKFFYMTAQKIILTTKRLDSV